MKMYVQCAAIMCGKYLIYSTVFHLYLWVPIRCFVIFKLYLCIVTCVVYYIVYVHYVPTKLYKLHNISIYNLYIHSKVYILHMNYILYNIPTIATAI